MPIKQVAVGVMGYQGGADLHLHALKTLGIPCQKITRPGELDYISGLILPGGESSVQYQYCVRHGFQEAIVAFAKTGKPILGTCAGAILLSSYHSEKVTGFGLIDIDIERNVYGRQMASGLKQSDGGAAILLIRAPGITRVGPEVLVLETYQGRPILVKQRHLYAATFHPEAINLGVGHLLTQIFG